MDFHHVIATKYEISPYLVKDILQSAVSMGYLMKKPKPTHGMSLEVLANAVRDVFSKRSGSRQVGLKPGSMGTKSLLIKNLAEWKMLNPEVSDSDIVKTAKFYVNKEGEKNNDYRYLRKAHYFVFKEQKSGGKDSLLSEYLEDAQAAETVDQNWDMDEM